MKYLKNKNAIFYIHILFGNKGFIFYKMTQLPKYNMAFNQSHTLIQFHSKGKIKFYEIKKIKKYYSFG